jgi:hypothetical protein
LTDSTDADFEGEKITKARANLSTDCSVWQSLLRRGYNTLEFGVAKAEEDFFVYFFGRARKCVGHSFAYVSNFVFLREVSRFEPRELPLLEGALPT